MINIYHLRFNIPSCDAKAFGNTGEHAQRTLTESWAEVGLSVGLKLDQAMIESETEQVRGGMCGLPGGTRTPYLELRRFELYPDELPAA